MFSIYGIFNDSRLALVTFQKRIYLHNLISNFLKLNRPHTESWWELPTGVALWKMHLKRSAGLPVNGPRALDPSSHTCALSARVVFLRFPTFSCIFHALHMSCVRIWLAVGRSLWSPPLWLGSHLFPAFSTAKKEIVNPVSCPVVCSSTFPLCFLSISTENFNDVNYSSPFQVALLQLDLRIAF